MSKVRRVLDLVRAAETLSHETLGTMMDSDFCLLLSFTTSRNPN